MVNAPGTPKITILPSLHMSARFTLFSGPPSINSMLGIESPTYDMMYINFTSKNINNESVKSIMLGYKNAVLKLTLTGAILKSNALLLRKRSNNVKVV